jgi:hypothetical protein
MIHQMMRFKTIQSQRERLPDIRYDIWKGPPVIHFKGNVLSESLKPLAVSLPPCSLRTSYEAISANGSAGFQHYADRLEECVTVAMALNTIARVLSARESRVSWIHGILVFRHSHEVAAQSQSQEARNLDGDQSQSCDAAFYRSQWNKFLESIRCQPLSIGLQINRRSTKVGLDQQQESPCDPNRRVLFRRHLQVADLRSSRRLLFRICQLRDYTLGFEQAAIL